MSEERGRRLMAAVGTFEDAITRLDTLRAGEFGARGARILRIRWALRTALADPLTDLRELAQVEYLTADTDTPDGSPSSEAPGAHGETG